MFVACINYLPRFPSHPCARRHLSGCGQLSRFSTSLRVYHPSDQIRSSKLRQWQRNFFIATGLIFIGTASYLYYPSTQRDSSFDRYSLVQKDPISSTASIFYLRPKHKSEGLEPFQQAWNLGIWNVHFKQPQLQIIRPYTPLPPTVELSSIKKDELRFLIRNDPQGEVSSYLHRIPLGSDIEIRGPNLEYSLPKDLHQVVFFAGGTGIAPALQVAHCMFNRHKIDVNQHKSLKQTPKLHILWANRRREDCLGGISDDISVDTKSFSANWFSLNPRSASKTTRLSPEDQGMIVREIEAIKEKFPGQLTIEYFVNTEDTWINESVVRRALTRFGDKDHPKGEKNIQDQRQILISGPNGFIAYLAGPKEWRNGKEEQGSVGGIIAQVLAKKNQSAKVWKI